MTFVLAGVAPVVTWAVCTCGFQDGSFTLATIALDGDMSDWTAVLADPDNNVCDGPAGGLMETGEPVIGVTWRGSNQLVNVYVYTYVSLAPAGDPVADSNGFGDGYTLPGSFANVPPTGAPNRKGDWGSDDGKQMEFFITWAELGLSTDQPFAFHVASSNVVNDQLLR